MLLKTNLYKTQIPSGIWHYLFFKLQSLIKRFFYLEPASNFLVSLSDCDYFSTYQTILLFFLANHKSCICCCLQVYTNCYSEGFRSIDTADILRTSHLYSTNSDRILLRTKKNQPPTKNHVPLNISLLHWILRINKKTQRMLSFYNILKCEDCTSTLQIFLTKFHTIIQKQAFITVRQPKV